MDGEECIIGCLVLSGAVRPGEEEVGSCWETETYRKLAGNQRWSLPELGAGRGFVCLFALAFQDPSGGEEACTQHPGVCYEGRQRRIMGDCFRWQLGGASRKWVDELESKLEEMNGSHILC